MSNVGIGGGAWEGGGVTGTGGDEGWEVYHREGVKGVGVPGQQSPTPDHWLDGGRVVGWGKGYERGRRRRWCDWSPSVPGGATPEP